MSGLSPASVLFSSDGIEIALGNGVVFPTGTRGIMSDGYDSVNGVPRFISVDASGNQIVVGAGVAGTPSGGVVSIQGVAGGTPVPISGTVTATNPSVGTDGAAALGFDTQVGAKVTTAAPTYTTGNLNALSLTTSGLLRIDGVYPLAATTPTSDGVFIAAAVTTAAPTYTTGQLDGLSLNTAGGVRIDGVSATGTTTGTTAMLSGGAVTTAAPTYTTGQMDPLSLTTLGGLRIDGVYAVGTANATAADVGSVGGYVTTAAPTYTTGQLNPLSLDTFGNLRVAAITNKAATSTVTSVAGATASTSVLASNTSRVFAAIYNNTTKNMYVLLGSGTASTSNFTTLLMTTDYWEVPNDYTGAINAIWSNGVSGSALVTELTP